MPAMSQPSPALQAADTVTRLTQVLAVGGVVALIVLSLVWELWLAPTGRGTLVILKLPLLLLPLPGLLKHRLYTYRWLSLAIWLYCMEGLVRATSERGTSSWLAIGEVLLSLIVFVACAAQVRWRLKRAKLSQPA
ncbi:MAG: DUF2069 domain-containing protein [Burkholderiales bacterium]|nr:DUF2069 domain-containing protein [Burkholderiales bacterium]